MTPDQARRYVEVLDLYAGDLEALVEETRADKPGLTSALNPHLHDMAHGVAAVREKITADAEAMTRMIAGMRAEYAVQNRVGDKWLYEDDDGRNLAPYDSHRIAWWPDPIPQSDIADRGEGMARIVRRYVTTPEEA